MTTFQKKLTIAFFITSLATASMATERDEDQELEKLQQQLVTLRLQNQEREEAREKELKKAHLLQQIEEEKQKSIALSRPQPQSFQANNPLQDFAITLNNTTSVGIQVLCDKATDQVDPQAPSKWVPIREEFKQQAEQVAVNFLTDFLNKRTKK